MINYLEKYNNLPKDLRDKISAPHVMNAMHELEEKYGVSLAALIMRVMVKDLHVDEVQNYLVYNLEMESVKASQLVLELRRRIFSEIANYLDYISNETQSDSEANLEKEAYEARFGLSNAGESNASAPKTATGANFYFSIEDEDEVRRQAKDLSGLDRREQIAMQVESKIDQIIGDINVIFSSEDMIKRLRQVLKTYLRGVRDKIDTKQALERDIVSGGLGLDEEISDDILKVVDLINVDESKNIGRSYQVKKFSVPEDQLVGTKDGMASSNGKISQDAPYDFTKLAEKKKEMRDALNSDMQQVKFDTDRVSDIIEFYDDDEEKEGLAKADTGEIAEEEESEEEEIVVDIQDGASDERKRLIEEKEKALVLDLSEKTESKPAPVLIATKDAARTIAVKAVVEEKAEEAQPSQVEFMPGKMAKARNMAPVTEDFSALNKPLANLSGKVKMEDIKKVAKLGGPLEEIGSMNLNDFRRLSRSPKEAATKIIDMFNLLEEEGFNKRMAGVKAWRQSPINKLYLAIGQDCLIQKRDVKKIIENRKKEEKDYLSLDEFNAIMELNKKLRY